MNILKNPLSNFIYYSIKTLFYIFLNRKKNLKIGYFCKLSNVKFGRFNRIYNGCSLSNCNLGDYTYLASNSDLNNVNVGSFCSIGPESIIGLPKHPTNNFISTHPIFYSKNMQCGKSFSKINHFNEFDETIIGNDVWIGARVTIIGGIKISDGAIIGAGSVVTKDIPPYAIVGGVPAKIIKYRFSSNEIDFISISKWWNYDRDHLETNHLSFHNFHNFHNFIKNRNCKYNDSN